MRLDIYGDSDDLIELEGAIYNEFNAFDGGAVTLTAPNGDALIVEGIFHRDGAWMFCPVPQEFGANTPNWEMSLAFGQRKPGEFGAGIHDKVDGVFVKPASARAATYTAVLTIDVPEGTVASFETHGLGGM